MSIYNVGIFVGSLRKESFNKKIAQFILDQEESKFSYRMIDIGDLPLYNQDFDDAGNPPASYTRFRQEVASLDAVLFVTAEYNRSIPAVLKNAIDVGSRPYGKNKWDGKPGAIISSSTGVYGGFGANHHLRQLLVFVNIPTMQQPEAYLGDIGSCIGPSGTVELAKTKDFLRSFKTAFEQWAERIIHTKRQN
ncbi:NAD(P)H-dependent oxidoreductase [Sphingobacterium sp. 40-24]|uniref:NADPH-dependent FMN reductase n=1 Tax=Sphingobacterium sp. 40-24 TaxID=1895843 RepID=UPI00095EDF9F|nr:NAD(P)H-dependent oxidoreductase [Sphingobacterium sp. 40-24]OJZ07569.1 MAG: ACP phosphodiesterase [Sphingobacterium sp. 40-24]